MLFADFIGDALGNLCWWFFIMVLAIRFLASRAFKETTAGKDAVPAVVRSEERPVIVTARLRSEKRVE